MVVCDDVCMYCMYVCMVIGTVRADSRVEY